MPLTSLPLSSTTNAPALPLSVRAQPGEDPFTQQRSAKRGRIVAQDKRQLANLKAAAKVGAPLPPTLRLAAALPEHGRGAPARRRELKQELSTATRQAAVSTASAGKFDRRVAGERPQDRSQGGRKRKFLAVTAVSTGGPTTGNGCAGSGGSSAEAADRVREAAEGPMGSMGQVKMPPPHTQAHLNPLTHPLNSRAQGGAEREQASKAVDTILRRHADDIVDFGKAISKYEAAAREERADRKKKKGGGGRAANVPAPAAGGKAGKGGKGGNGAGKKGGKKW